MNTAEWILVVILSLTLLVFLVVATIFLIKLIDITKEAKIVVKTSQGIAEKTEDVVENVKDFTSIGGIAKAFANRIDRNGVEIDLSKKPKIKVPSDPEPAESAEPTQESVPKTPTEKPTPRSATKPSTASNSSTRSAHETKSKKSSKN